MVRWGGKTHGNGFQTCGTYVANEAFNGTIKISATGPLHVKLPQRNKTFGIVRQDSVNVLAIVSPRDKKAAYRQIFEA